MCEIARESQPVQDVSQQSEAQLSRNVWAELNQQYVAGSADRVGGQRVQADHQFLEFNTRDLYGSSTQRPQQSGDGTPSQAVTDASMHAKYINRQGTEIDDGGTQYRGTLIRRDVPVVKHLVQSGQSLTSIARDHLGPGATQTDIRNHVREIQEVNHLDPHARPSPGQRLILPGHTEDGGFIAYDGGTTRTIWQNGTERVEPQPGRGYVRRANGTEHHWGPSSADNYDVSRTADGGIQVTDSDGDTRTRWNNSVFRVTNHDGTGYVYTPAGNSSYSEHHWGPRASDNYDLTRDADGHYRVADRPGQTPAEVSNASADIRIQRARVRDLAEQRLNDPQQRERFADNMERLEHRQLPPEEVARTYAAISRILEAEGDSPLRPDERTRIAQEVLQNAAEPTSINQGMHPTCNVASLEVRMYTRNPSVAAGLVADVSTTTHFQTADRSIIDVDSGSLHSDGDGSRNHASQIFQVTAVNVFWQRHGDFRYQQGPPNMGQLPRDNGERMIDYSQNPPREVNGQNGRPLQEPWISNAAIVEINEQINGRAEPPFIVSHAAESDSYTSLRRVNSEQELGATLDQMQRAGQFPAIIYVHGGQEPFWTDSGAGSAGGAGGWHVLNVTDYQAGPPATVAVDNTWGAQADHLTPSRRIPVSQLFRAMRAPTSQPVRATIIPPSGTQATQTR